MKLIGLIFLIIYSTDLSSQDLVYFDRLSNHEFTDGTSVGKLHEFGHVFERDDELHTLFKKFNRSRRTQRILNFTALGFAGATVVGASAFGSDGSDTGLIFAALTVLSGTALSGVTLLIGNGVVGSIKTNRKDHLLDSLGAAAIGYRAHWNLGITDHGAGFQLQF